MRKKIFTLLAVLGVVAITASAAPGPDPKDVPLVYSAENTGANCPLPPLPTVDQLPSIVRLPDPFKMENGSKITSFDQWECRRNEIKAQIENYEIGVRPNRPTDISATYADGTLTVVVKDNGKTVTLTSKVTMPAAGTGPFPVIIGMNSPTGSLPSSIFDGFIQIPFMHDQVSVYGSSPQKGPFYDMYPELAAAGQYCAWAWGVSRLIDGIELVQKDLNADLEHIGVTGCSYAGKMALYAGAFDERVALTIAQESGGGGTASWRVSETLGSVENLSSTNYTWFMQALKDNFDKKVDRLPYDHHELIAMIAPRAFLALGNDILWLADESGYVSCMAAKEVWKFMGVEDRIGFDLTGGHGHCSPPDSQVASATSFVNKFLRGNEETNTSIAITNYKTNYQFWMSDWANVTEPDVPLESYWYEGEGVADNCSTIGGDFAVMDDSNASNGKYVIAKEDLSSINTPPGNEGLITIPFSINNPKDFHIYFRMNCSTDGSFWVKIDDGQFVAYDKLNTNGEWKWVNIVNPTLLAGTGNHTLTIGYRSGGVKLDKINITNDPTQLPDGIGEKETECMKIPPCSIIDFETGNITGWIKQNPGAGIDITQEDKHSGEYALKMKNGMGTSAWSVQAFSPAFDMISGHTYNVSFWIKAVDGGGKGRISTTGAGQLGPSQYWADFDVSGEWQQVSYKNLAAGGSSIQLSFDIGYIANKTYYIDDIVLEDITVSPSPAVRVQETSWNAGQVSINESLQSNKFSIRNIGTGTLNVTKATELSAPWSTSLEIGTGLSLDAGQVQEFSFIYAPTAIGESMTDFSIETNVGNATIELRGEGKEGTGISDIENPDVKIFSIPGKINIAAPADSTVKISDMIGKAIGTYNMYKSPLELSLHSGIYVVSVELGSKSYTQKVIVK